MVVRLFSLTRRLSAGISPKAISAEVFLEGVTKKAKHKIKEKEKSEKKADKQRGENAGEGHEGDGG